jgi:hypothetical protein
MMPDDQRSGEAAAAAREPAPVEGANASAMNRGSAAVKGSAAAAESTAAEVATSAMVSTAAMATATVSPSAVSATDFGDQRFGSVFRHWRGGSADRRERFCLLGG